MSPEMIRLLTIIRDSLQAQLVTIWTFDSDMDALVYVDGEPYIPQNDYADEAAMVGAQEDAKFIVKVVSHGSSYRRVQNLYMTHEGRDFLTNLESRV